MFRAIRITVLTLLCILVFTGLNAQKKTNPKGIVGKIEKKSYTFEEYNSIYNNYCDFWQMKDGKKLTNDRKQALNNQCWDELIGRSIYDNEIKRRSLIISDQEAMNSVLKNPPTQIKQIEALKTNGKFDLEKLKKALEVDATFKKNVLDLVKETMIYDKLFTVIKSAVKAKPDSIKQVWITNNNLVSAKVIFFDYSKVTNISVADSEAYNHYIAKLETYKRDPARRFRYVKLNQDMYAEKSKSKAKADSLYNVLINGGDFTTLAIEFSEDPGSGKQGGDLGYFTKGRMVREFENAAFSLDVNSISKPIKSQFGWHIIQTMDKRKNEQEQDEVRARHILVKSESEDSITQLMTADAEDLASHAKTKGLAIAATEMGYQIAETKEFYEKDKGIREFSGEPELVSIAFSNPIGFMPEIIKSKNNEIFVCEVSDSLGIHYSPFETEKAGIVRVLEREKKIAANKTLAHNFYNSNSGGDYLAAAAKDSIKIVEAQDIKKDGSIPGIGNVKALTDSLLNTEEGHYTVLVENETNAYLAYVTKRVKPDIKKWEKEKNGLIAKANEEMKSKHLNQWYYTQRQKIKVEDNRSEYYDLPKPQSNAQNIQINPQF